MATLTSFVSGNTIGAKARVVRNSNRDAQEDSSVESTPPSSLSSASSSSCEEIEVQKQPQRKTTNKRTVRSTGTATPASATPSTVANSKAKLSLKKDVKKTPVVNEKTKVQRKAPTKRKMDDVDADVEEGETAAIQKKTDKSPPQKKRRTRVDQTQNSTAPAKKTRAKTRKGPISLEDYESEDTYKGAYKLCEICVKYDPRSCAIPNPSFSKHVDELHPDEAERLKSSKSKARAAAVAAAREAVSGTAKVKRNYAPKKKTTNDDVKKTSDVFKSNEKSKEKNKGSSDRKKKRAAKEIVTADDEEEEEEEDVFEPPRKITKSVRKAIEPTIREASDASNWNDLHEVTKLWTEELSKAVKVLEFVEVYCTSFSAKIGYLRGVKVKDVEVDTDGELMTMLSEVENLTVHISERLGEITNATIRSVIAASCINSEVQSRSNEAKKKEESLIVIDAAQEGNNEKTDATVTPGHQVPETKEIPENDPEAMQEEKEEEQEEEKENSKEELSNEDAHSGQALEESEEQQKDENSSDQVSSSEPSVESNASEEKNEENKGDDVEKVNDSDPIKANEGEKAIVTEEERKTNDEPAQSAPVSSGKGGKFPRSTIASPLLNGPPLFAPPSPSPSLAEKENATVETPKTQEIQSPKKAVQQQQQKQQPLKSCSYCRLQKKEELLRCCLVEECPNVICIQCYNKMQKVRGENAVITCPPCRKNIGSSVFQKNLQH